MNRLMKAALCAMLAAAPVPALAQTYWYTPGGSGVNGAVGMCLNGSGQAVPCGAGASTTGGSSSYSEIVPANTTGILVGAAGAHTAYELDVSNIGSSALWVKLYDTATAPTCGSGTPIRRFMIPANSTAANGAGSNIPLGTSGIAFVNGIGLCVTGGIADADTTAPTASVATVGLSYK